MSDDMNPYQSPQVAPGPVLVSVDAPGGLSVIPFESGGRRAKWAIILLASCLVTTLLDAASLLYEMQLLALGNAGEDVEALIDMNIMAQGIVGLVHLSCSLVSVVVFLMWHHRVYRNLPALGMNDRRFSPGWAVGQWFIPIFNLFRPYQTIAETWRGSDPAPLHNRTQERFARTNVALIGWWWAFFIIMDALNRGASRFAMRADTLDEVMLADGLLVLAALVTVPATVLAILVVHRIDRRQEDRFKLLQPQDQTETPDPSALDWQ